MLCTHIAFFSVTPICQSFRTCLSQFPDIPMPIDASVCSFRMGAAEHPLAGGVQLLRCLSARTARWRSLAGCTTRLWRMIGDFASTAGSPGMRGLSGSLCPTAAYLAGDHKYEMCQSKLPEQSLVSAWRNSPFARTGTTAGRWCAGGQPRPFPGSCAGSLLLALFPLLPYLPPQPLDCAGAAARIASPVGGAGEDRARGSPARRQSVVCLSLPSARRTRRFIAGLSQSGAARNSSGTKPSPPEQVPAAFGYRKTHREARVTPVTYVQPQSP